MKTLLKGLVAATILSTTLAISSLAAAVDLPATIRVIVAYNAGGSSDTLARVTIPRWEAALEEITGQSTNTVIVNAPGAGGEIGWTRLSQAAGDGGTIGVINLPAVPLVERTRNSAYKPWLESFAPIAVNVIDPNVARLAKTSKYKTMQEAIDAAIANPGSVTVGADGPLSDDHAAMYAIEEATGAKFTFIPYSGSSAANRAFMAGEVDIVIGNVFDHTKSAEAAAEAMVLLPSRYDFIPDVPTAEELVGIKGLDLGSVRGFAAPASIDPELLKLYQDAFAMAYADEAFIAEMRAKNLTVVDALVGDAFGQKMADQEKLADTLFPLFKAGGYAE
ncbi:MAG: tripartite tricarboxylate transporter substrate binding protein [Alphaproteobacteria bacterium]|nr:tripartite tricarboxylate transporter substrate binding protein [Alphaproteobacteria bacterium]